MSQSTARDILPYNGNDAAIRSAFESMRAAVRLLDGFAGDALDSAVTWRQLVDQGLVQQLPGRVPVGQPPGTIIVPVGSVSDEPDLTPPPTPSGVAATAGFSSVIVTTDPPAFTMGHGAGSTRVYGVKRDPLSTAPLPTFGDATLVTEVFGATSVVSFPSDMNVEWHLWVKWKTHDGVESVTPAGGTNGIKVTTGQDITQLLKSLTHAVFDPAAPYTKTVFRADLFAIAPRADFYQDTPTPTATATGQLWYAPTSGVTKVWNGSAWVVFNVPLPFVVNTTSVTEDGVTIPPGVYMDAAYIRNLDAMIARFGSATIDDAMIATLTAAKITSGNLAVGVAIQSQVYTAGSAGWHIDYTGFAEFNNVTARGTIVASAGAIGGISIGSTFLRSSGWVTATTGFTLNTDGSYEFNAGGTFRGTLNIKSGTSGARMEFTNSYQKVFDSGGTRRVQVGDLSA